MLTISGVAARMALAGRPRVSVAGVSDDRHDRDRGHAVKYLCPFRAPDGSTREVVVTLSADEQGDCVRNFPDAPTNPLSLHYAWRRASMEAPFPEFEPLFDQAGLVH